MNDLQKKCAQLPEKPGIYGFLDKTKKIIYVGKARDLKKRVTQYCRNNIVDRKTMALMAQATDIEITITNNENQALLLESHLIKKYQPKYNVLLRDDKSYPYLYLSTEDEYPRLDVHRGEKRKKGRYFGPYPNAGSVRDNLALMQKLFQLRQCSDIFFKSRTRPCLQYQIKRCTAPCVKFLSKINYDHQVTDAIHFLEGKNKTVIKSLEKRMEIASRAQQYELAAATRDILIRLRQLHSEQFMTDIKGNIDVFGVAEKINQIAIAVISIRHGQLLGHKTFFPSLPENTTVDEALSAFIPQYYLHPTRAEEPVDRVILPHDLSDRVWIQNALRETFHHRVQILFRHTRAHQTWQSMAAINASNELSQFLTDKNNLALKLMAFQKALALSDVPTRIECFDISHTQGTHTKASCVVFGIEGPIRRDYRQFNIHDITPGDDYAAMAQAISRRYTKLKTDNKTLPNVIIIDGGKGQLKVAANVLESLQINDVCLLCVAKGVARKVGQEKLFVWGNHAPIRLSVDDPALHLIQFIRDEAHRFALTSHRKARSKKQFQSVLDTITGVGKKRKADLLRHFGGLQELKGASIADIEKVNNISNALAQIIYSTLHKD